MTDISMQLSVDSIIDVRSIIPRERHSLIFNTFQRLEPTHAFILVNDHDPKPLYYQFQAEHPGRFGWIIWKKALTSGGLLSAGPREQRRLVVCWARETFKRTTHPDRDGNPDKAANGHRADRSYLKCSAKKNVDTQCGKYSDRRDSDRCGQSRCPTFPPKDPAAGNNVGKAGNKIEPKNKGNNVSGSRPLSRRAEQSLSSYKDSDYAKYHRDEGCRDSPTWARCRFRHPSRLL
jgi:hypothetical protein